MILLYFFYTIRCNVVHRGKILKYDDKITLYPGHGDSTTLGNERKNNPYLK